MVPADKKGAKPVSSTGVAKPKAKEETKEKPVTDKAAKAKQPPSPKNVVAKPEEKKKNVS